ncbi:MAG: hypothetical protein NUV80_06120 [Candidatus Berkelbacteria bacterium]|nr:hypothetical protein [Candidatus Berkelbacteria bacterium]
MKEYDEFTERLLHKTYNVTVHFDEEIPEQGIALLAFEKHLRQLTGMDIRVFKDKMGDDSKIRQRMTPDERSRL